MKEFMMIFRNEKNTQTQMPTPEQLQAAMKMWQEWIGAIAKKGNYIGTGRLSDLGKTVAAGNIVVDGPYAELKEVVGGYLSVKAKSLDEALEMAKSCPNLIMGGKVEVRSLMPMDTDPASLSFLKPL